MKKSELKQLIREVITEGMSKLPKDIQSKLERGPLSRYKKRDMDGSTYYYPKRESDKAYVEEVNKFMKELGFKLERPVTTAGTKYYRWTPGPKVERKAETDISNLSIGVRTQDDIRMDMFDIMDL